MTYGTKWLMMHAVPASLTQETIYGWWPMAAGISVIGALSLPRMESSQAGRDSGVVLGMKLSFGEAADRLGNRSLLTDVGCLTSPSFLHEPKATETSFNSPVQPI